MGVIIVTSTHQQGPRERRGGSTVGKPVVIGSGSWIGARATILPGITVGAGCIIGAGSLVVADCEADHVYVGVPARPIRRIEDSASSAG
ncbi:DapH/DapD/GlmU-related protein [Blastococcus mobilis]|uniref:DapH/DapD/GlmU-related protein n=1 Tax=Blastococcus mobilis TaxID=1938746 RepID=UPI0034A0C9FA